MVITREITPTVVSQALGKALVARPIKLKLTPGQRQHILDQKRSREERSDCWRRMTLSYYGEPIAKIRFATDVQIRRSWTGRRIIISLSRPGG